MKNVLFVCTGNTCRSPIAEMMLRQKQDPTIDVKSAGVFASVGSDASDGTKQVLTEKGLECDHSSQQLTEELINWATVILTMTEGHKYAILQRFPDALPKLYTLKEFVEGAEVDKDIQDPFGGPVETYRTTAAEIERLVNKLPEALEQ
ncbi:low molecular weight protein arginine phosphatase [Bacillus alkalicellulosilyticus]|uniref:low molecular weight protein arginine phosphatase n=1 Tax=Alkalihalobacterium alkalicellulosilyticum TaxID=1912214 RepID=UPI000996796F|nr:low molecular weight protein arginine phosphatase [Bacillus alkalicellulosilyticus]